MVQGWQMSSSHHTLSVVHTLLRNSSDGMKALWRGRGAWAGLSSDTRKGVGGNRKRPRWWVVWVCPLDSTCEGQCVTVEVRGETHLASGQLSASSTARCWQADKDGRGLRAAPIIRLKSHLLRETWGWPPSHPPTLHSVFKFYLFYLFIYIYFWLCWVFGSCEGFL